MNGISVQQTAREFLATVDDLKGRGMRRATSMALNRAADGVRVDASREIRARYKISVATVNKAITRQLATPDRLTVMVRVRGGPLSLGGFSARQVRKGVTVNVKGARKLIPHAFLRTQRAGELVFMRVGKSRYPIKALKTVDIPGLFVLEDINAKVRSLVQGRFINELRAAVRAVAAQG